MICNESDPVQTILEIGRRLWQRGYIAANDGNISVRCEDGTLLTTPTGVSKGFMTPEMILRVDPDGRVLLTPDSRYRPSSEVRMHIEVYRQREDVCGVVHAHPPVATAFAVAGIPLDRHILPEAVLTLGVVRIAPYGTPSTPEIPLAIRPFLRKSDAVLLANHGALTLGADVMTAYHRMETLEHTARILHKAMQIGRVQEIPPEEIAKLMEIRKQLNIPGRIDMPGRMNPDRFTAERPESGIRDATSDAGPNCL
ncbi:MAG TPA: class II aldolase/adducin family protein [bacterium]|nr:class II aldolase/adducin family protein [bacterium]